MATGETNGTGHPASVMRFAAMVRRSREKRGWSQTVLAETAHVDHNVISRLEAGTCDPPFSLVADLTRILDLPIENAVFNQKISKQIQGNEEEAHDS